MTFHMIYSQYGGNDFDDFNTLDEAWQAMEGGEDLGEIFGICVLDMENKIAYVPDISPIGTSDNYRQEIVIKVCKKLDIDVTGYKFEQKKFW